MPFFLPNITIILQSSTLKHLILRVAMPILQVSSAACSIRCSSQSGSSPRIRGKFGARERAVAELRIIPPRMRGKPLPDALSGYDASTSGFGHAYDYYMNNPLRKTAEPFAEMLTVQLSNEGTWEAMQWAFPTSCRWLNDQIMKGI